MTVLDRISGFADDLVAWRHDFHAHPELGFEEERTAGVRRREARLLGVAGASRRRPDRRRRRARRGATATVAASGCAPTWTPCRSRRRPSLPTARRRRARCTPAAMTGTPRCCSARRATSPRRATSTAPRCSSSSRPRRGSAAPARCSTTGCSSASPATRSTACTTGRTGRAARSRCGPAPRWRRRDFFDIRIKGQGAHGAHPDQSRDPIVIAMTLGQAMQTIVSRNADPLKAMVVSITQIHAGSAYNVIPDDGASRRHDTHLRRGDARACRDPHPRACGRDRGGLRRDDRGRHPRYLLRSPQPRRPDRGAPRSRRPSSSARDNVETGVAPKMGSEDFADMLQAVPGAYVWLGRHAGAGPAQPGLSLRRRDPAARRGASRPSRREALGRRLGRLKRTATACRAVAPGVRRRIDGRSKARPKSRPVSGSPVQGSMQRNGAPGFVHSARCRKPSGSTTIAEPPGAWKRTERLETSFKTSAPASNISGFQGQDAAGEGRPPEARAQQPLGGDVRNSPHLGRSKRSR